MENTGQFQQNEHGVNVLVDTTNSSNRHVSYMNKRIQVVKVLSESEIIELWKNRDVEIIDELKLAKDWIKKQSGYAVSNCQDKTLGIDYGSIVNIKQAIK